MMCCRRCHRHCAHGVPLVGWFARGGAEADERPIDMGSRAPPLQRGRPVHAVGQCRDVSARYLEGALESAVEDHSFTVPSGEPETKRAPAGSTATALTIFRAHGSPHAPSRHMVMSREAVIMRPPGDVATLSTSFLWPSKQTRRCFRRRCGIAERAAGALHALDVADEAELRQYEAEGVGG